MEYQNIYPALECLVSISEKRQKEARDMYPDFSSKDFAKQYCTIKCCTSRRGGHDYGTAELVAKRDWTIVQVASNLGIAHIFEEELKCHGGGKIDISVTPKCFNTRLVGRDLSKIDAVIFTCCNAFSHSELDNFYTMFASYFLANKDVFFFIQIQ